MTIKCKWVFTMKHCFEQSVCIICKWSAVFIITHQIANRWAKIATQVKGIKKMDIISV